MQMNFVFMHLQVYFTCIPIQFSYTEVTILKFRTTYDDNLIVNLEIERRRNCL